MTFEDFKRLYLIRATILSGADFDARLLPEQIASEIQGGYFPRSWVMPTQFRLIEGGFLTLNDDDSVSLTVKGLEEAERTGFRAGVNLWGEIEAKRERNLAQEGQAIEEELPIEAGLAHGPVSIFGAAGGEPEQLIVIDPLSDAFKELDEQLRLAIRDLRGNNELNATEGPEASRRLAELEAGTRLLNAEQVDANLIRRVLLPSLSWFAKKLRDEAASQLIKKLIAMIVAYLGGS